MRTIFISVAIVCLLIPLISPLFAQGGGISIKLLLPSIRIELNPDLVKGKLYCAPQAPVFIGYQMGRVEIIIEYKK
ncbi:MAG: hypothetical protein ACPL6C_04595, partial [bacterium]